MLAHEGRTGNILACAGIELECVGGRRMESGEKRKEEAVVELMQKLAYHGKKARREFTASKDRDGNTSLSN